MSSIDKLSPEQLLRRYFKAQRPIIYINHYDFEEIDTLIEGVCSKAFARRGYEIIEFTEAFGQVDFKTKNPKIGNNKLGEFLKRFNTDLFSKNKKEWIVVLKEVHESLNDKEVFSALQSIVQRKSMTKGEEGILYPITIIIVNSKMRIPSEIEKYVTLIEITPPSASEVREIIYSAVGKENVVKEDEKDLIMALGGLSAYEIKQIVRLAMTDDGAINKDDLDLIFSEKRQAIQKTGLLELVDGIDKVDLGDFDNLTEYLEGKKEIFRNLADARENGVDSPSGIMLVGMPGCGKSLSASCVAKMFGCPLLKLDIGRILGKYVGESEENLRKAIRVAEAASPCVLWIDEIEKAFAGVSGGGNELMTRMFGYFLTWLQEKTLPVYVLATANNISNLPPEFTRRGRFDEIFKVGLPEGSGIEKIFRIHVENRSRNKVLKPNIDYKRIQTLCKDKKYSGADIASIVKEAAEIAYLDNKRVISQSDLEKLIGKTVSSNKSQEKNPAYQKMVEDLSKLEAKSVSK